MPAVIIIFRNIIEHDAGRLSAIDDASRARWDSRVSPIAETWSSLPCQSRAQGADMPPGAEGRRRKISSACRASAARYLKTMTTATVDAVSPAPLERFGTTAFSPRAEKALRH